MWPGPDSSSHYLGKSLTIEDEACRPQLVMFKTVIEFAFQSDALQICSYQLIFLCLSSVAAFLSSVFVAESHKTL